MKIWVFSDPADYKTYARATRLDMWSDLQIDSEGRIEPLVMEWEADSDCIGDFTWPSLDKDIVVTEQVGDALKERFCGFSLGQVEMVQNVSMKKIRSEIKKGKRRVVLPYKGPKLINLFVKKWVSFDFKKSSFTASSGGTGEEIYNVYGVEKVEVKYDKTKNKTIYTRTPRISGKGIFINFSDLNGADIFRIKQLPASIFCSDVVKKFVEKEKFSNVQFLEMGDIYK